MTNLIYSKLSYRVRRLSILVAPALTLGVLAAAPARADAPWYGHHHKHRSAYVGAVYGYGYAPPPVVYVAPPPVIYAPPRVIYAPAPVVYAPPRLIYVPAPVYPSFSFGISVPLH